MDQLGNGLHQLVEHGLFEFEAGALRGRTLQVTRFIGEEAISELFTFRIEMTSELPYPVIESLLFGQPAKLVIHGPAHSRRVVRGVVRAVESRDGTHDSVSHGLDFDSGLEQLENLLASSTPLTHFAVELVPRLALLRECRRSRIFQEQTVQSIVTQILNDWGIPSSWSLSERHGPWSYCVQHQESDYDFIRRILAGEGIFFYFDGDSIAADAADRLAGPLGNGAVSTGLSLAEDVVDACETVVFGDNHLAYSDSARLPSSVLGVSPPALRPMSSGEATLRTAVAPRRAPLGQVPNVDLPGALRIHADRTASWDEEYIYRFSRRRVLTPKSYLARDYNPENALHAPRAVAHGVGPIQGPSQAQDFAETAIQERLASGIFGGLSRMPIRGGTSAPTSARFDQRLAEVYEFSPQRTPGGEYSAGGARGALEQYQQDHMAAEGESTCRGLAPGNTMRVLDDSLSSMTLEYVVTKLISKGVVRELVSTKSATYENSFEAVPSEVTFRPLRRPRPGHQILETAVVVGPEEIFTDALGRIKVRFHWDIGSSDNESKSCWIRVSQSWSGPSFGTHFTPRVGQEVLVSFIGGDLDRPIVIGCVPNSVNPSPYRLPAEKTRSGIVTRSSPGGTGYNELTFEDHIGSEEIFVRAERDLNEEVLNDQATTVGHSQYLDVGLDQETTVGRDRTDTVTNNAVYNVHHNRNLNVAGDNTTHVVGNDVRAVSSNQRLHVGGDRTTDVIGTHRHNVHGVAHTRVESSSIARLEGCAVVAVGTASEERALVFHVEGQSRSESSKELEILSKTSVRIQCGKSFILLTPECIQLSSPKVVVDGFKDMSLFGDNFHVVAQQSAHLKGAEEGVFLTGKTAKLSLVDELIATPEIHAPQIHVQASTITSTDPRAVVAHGPVTKIELRDDTTHRPLPDQPFLLRQGSVQRAGVLDANGKAELLGLTGSWEIDFPEVNQWHLDSATPPPRPTTHTPTPSSAPAGSAHADRAQRADQAADNPYLPSRDNHVFWGDQPQHTPAGTSSATGSRQTATLLDELPTAASPRGRA